MTVLNRDVQKRIFTNFKTVGHEFSTLVSITLLFHMFSRTEGLYFTILQYLSVCPSVTMSVGYRHKLHFIFS